MPTWSRSCSSPTPDHDDAKQIADIQDLVSQRRRSSDRERQHRAGARRRGQPGAANSGIPVVMVDRRVASDNFVTFVTASDALMGRLFAQWIVEKLHGKGNVVILGGQAGSSPNDNRVEVRRCRCSSAYPDIKILDTVYSDWSPVKGKQVMQAMIAKYGHQHQCGVRSARPAGARRDRGLPGSRLEGQRDSADAHVGRHERPDEDGDQAPLPAARHRLPAGHDGRLARGRAEGAVGSLGAVHLHDQRPISC